MDRATTHPVLVALLLLATTAAADEPPVEWELAGGQTELVLNRHVLADLGITASTSPQAERQGGFSISLFEVDSGYPRMVLSKPGGSLEGHVHGALRHRGMLDLQWNDQTVVVSDFELVPAVGEGLFDVRSEDGLRVFFVDNAHAEFVAESGEYLFLNMDLRITDELAELMGRPEIAGHAVGAAHVRTQRLAQLGSALEGGACPSDFSGDTDVALTSLTTLTEEFHNETAVAMAPSATLLNVGDADVPWYRAIAPDGEVGQHPYLYLALYRLADGVLHQIGASDLKHAFFAVNSGCPCPGGQILYEGCGDTYGVYTNVARFNFGPREELESSTGTWSSDGSHFDGTPQDDFRHHHGESDHPDPFEHLLTATVADLTTAGARYFYSAWYLTRKDIDIFNSMGFREVVPNQDSGWTFPHAPGDSLVNGPPTHAWVDPAALSDGEATTLIDECTDAGTDDCDGHLQVAVKVTEIAGGTASTYRYDYAVMNLDYDRQIDSFSVPLPSGVNVTETSFRDPDSDAGNDWEVSIGPHAVSWDLPDGQLSGLDWGTLYNFSFVADMESTDVIATLGVFEAGSPASLTAATKGPIGELPMVSLTVSTEGDGSGRVTSAPPGIDCLSDCDESFGYGTEVTLTATADPGSEFYEWLEGGLSVGSTTDLEIVLTENRTIDAVFDPCELTVSNEQISTSEVFRACETLIVGPSVVVEGTGNAALIGGTMVRIDELSVLTGGSLAVGIGSVEPPGTP